MATNLAESATKGSLPGVDSRWPSSEIRYTAWTARFPLFRFSLPWKVIPQGGPNWLPLLFTSCVVMWTVWLCLQSWEHQMFSIQNLNGWPQKVWIKQLVCRPLFYVVSCVLFQWWFKLRAGIGKMGFGCRTCLVLPKSIPAQNWLKAPIMEWQTSSSIFLKLCNFLQQLHEAGGLESWHQWVTLVHTLFSLVAYLRCKLLVIHWISLAEETNHCRGEEQVHVLGIGQIFLLEVCPFTSIVRSLSIFYWKDWRQQYLGS